jgi:hypothetical protein
MKLQRVLVRKLGLLDFPVVVASSVESKFLAVGSIECEEGVHKYCCYLIL